MRAEHACKCGFVHEEMPPFQVRTGKGPDWRSGDWEGLDRDSIVEDIIIALYGGALIVRHTYRDGSWREWRETPQEEKE